MRIPHTYFTKLIMLFFVLFSFFSCSKDTDLLVDYVVADSQSILVEIKVVALANEPVIIDPIVEGTDGIITEVTDPAMGTAVVNEDNTITYTPNSDTTGTDEFGYTTTETSGSVAVTTVSDKIDVWKLRFKNEWERSLPYYNAQTSRKEVDSRSGQQKGHQRRYYDFRVIDGLIYMLQATGDLDYIDDLVWYLDRVIAIDTNVGSGYRGWPVPLDTGGVGESQLYDGHGYRNIHKFLYLAKKYPAVKARLTKAKYDSYLSYWTTNLWDKWISRGNGNIMRSNTHMASHMSSNVALYLSLLTDDAVKKAEYLSWVNAWNDDASNKTTKNTVSGVGFRDQLRIESGSYIWESKWTGTGVTDMTHANAGVQSVVNQFHQGIGWSQSEIDLFVDRVNDLMDFGNGTDHADIPYNLDGTGILSNNFMHYGWAMLGRFDENTQARLEDYSPSKARTAYYYNCFLGIMAYNQAYLEGTLVYPEF